MCTVYCTHTPSRDVVSQKLHNMNITIVPCNTIPYYTHTTIVWSDDEVHGSTIMGDQSQRHKTEEGEAGLLGTAFCMRAVGSESMNTIIFQVTLENDVIRVRSMIRKSVFGGLGRRRIPVPADTSRTVL
eukprot:scaffold17707_cov212-Amphora_coffeaeformis.AAC.7